LSDFFFVLGLGLGSDPKPTETQTKMSESKWQEYLTKTSNRPIYLFSCWFQLGVITRTARLTINAWSMACVAKTSQVTVNVSVRQKGRCMCRTWSLTSSVVSWLWINSFLSRTNQILGSFVQLKRTACWSRVRCRWGLYSGFEMQQVLFMQWNRLVFWADEFLLW